MFKTAVIGGSCRWFSTVFSRRQRILLNPACAGMTVAPGMPRVTSFAIPSVFFVSFMVPEKQDASPSPPSARRHHPRGRGAPRPIRLVVRIANPDVGPAPACHDPRHAIPPGEFHQNRPHLRSAALRGEQETGSPGNQPRNARSGLCRPANRMNKWLVIWPLASRKPLFSQPPVRRSRDRLRRSVDNHAPEIATSVSYD